MVNPKWLMAMGAMALVCGIAAEPANNKQWVGVWHAELDGQPGVTLTLADDRGGLGGTIVFYLVKKDHDAAKVQGGDVRVVLDPKVEGEVLHFHVIRSSDQRDQEVRVELTGENKGRLKCTTCGGSPEVEITKETYGGL